MNYTSRMAKARSKSCKLYVWVAPAVSTRGIAVFRREAGSTRKHEFMRFSKVSTAKTFVRSMIKREGACFVSTKTLRSARPKSKR